MLWTDFEKTVEDKDVDAFLLWLEDPDTSPEDLLNQLNLPNAHSNVSDTSGN